MIDVVFICFISIITLFVLLNKYKNTKEEQNVENEFTFLRDLPEISCREALPCVVDANCKFCLDKTKCRDGKCVVSSNLPQSKCDNNLGFFMVKRDTIVSQEWFCLNTKKHVYNSEAVEHSWVCYGGKFDVDQNKCVCDDSRIAFTLSNVPLCIRPSDEVKL